MQSLWAQTAPPPIENSPQSSKIRQYSQYGENVNSENTKPSQSSSKSTKGKSLKNTLGFAFLPDEQRQIARELELYYLNSRLLWYTQTRQTKLLRPLFKQLKKKFPHSAQRDYFQALAYHSAGKQAQALAASEQALKKDPAFARAWNLKGLLLSNAEQDAQSLLCFQKASALNPYHQNYVYNLGLAFYKLGQYSKAMAASKRALDLKSNYANPHYLQALIYRKEGKVRKAFAAFTLAEEFGLKGTEFYLDYLDLVQELGESAESLRLAKLLSQKRNKSAAMLRSLAQVWQNSGGYSQALRFLRALIRRAEANKSDHKNYVFVIVKKGLPAPAYINAMPLKGQAKKELKLYAQELSKKFKRLKLLQAQDPVLRLKK